jgi:hypothetical protein
VTRTLLRQLLEPILSVQPCFSLCTEYQDWLAASGRFAPCRRHIEPPYCLEDPYPNSGSAGSSRQVSSSSQRRASLATESTWKVSRSARSGRRPRRHHASMSKVALVPLSSPATVTTAFTLDCVPKLANGRIVSEGLGTAPAGAELPSAVAEAYKGLLVTPRLPPAFVGPALGRMSSRWRSSPAGVEGFQHMAQLGDGLLVAASPSGWLGPRE